MPYTRKDLSDLITEIVKVHPDATDTTKLQGARHRVLLEAMLDYVDNAGGGAGNGEFPFDWTIPSNAFNGYSNNETTFASGMFKFLHRDTEPSAQLNAINPRRQAGSDEQVTLTWDVRPGSAQLASLVVNGIAQPTPIARFGTQQTIAANNQDKVFSLVVADALGQTTTANALVQYRQPGFLQAGTLSDYAAASDAELSTSLIAGGSGGLVDTRQMSAVVSCSGQPLVIAFQAALAPSGFVPAVVVNGLADTSFTVREFVFTNSDGFDEDYLLLVGGNELYGSFTVVNQ